MTSWLILDRLPCVILMAAAAGLFLWRPSARSARTAWTILLAAGLVHAAVLATSSYNLVNVNVVHHFLGAKYTFPYTSMYKVTNAALDRPQIAMHDLDHPPLVYRETPAEQRGYFIDLLRSDSVSFDPHMPLPTLESLAVTSGAIHREAEQILKKGLPADQIADFKQDVKLALIDNHAEQNIQWEGGDITCDYGYNGSPFYTLVRHVDPTLYLPFGRATAILNVIWQILGMLLVAWLVGAALEMNVTERIAIAALLFASWDIVAWDIPGLVFGGLWLPVAVALWAGRKGKPVVAGVAVAWAALLKIFPFILLLPSGVQLARAVWNRVRGREISVPWKFHLLLVASSLLSVLVLGGLSELSGRTWSDFLHKILVQFQSGEYLTNSVGLSQLLFSVGIVNSPVISILTVVSMGVLVLACWRPDGRNLLPRRLILVLAVAGWFIHTWFNYYAVAPLLLLPLVARAHSRGAALSAAALAISFFLPELTNRALQDSRLLYLVKLLPYSAIPAWLFWVEFKPFRLGTLARRGVTIIAACVALLVLGEAVHKSLIRQYDAGGGQFLDQGDARSALGYYNSLISMAPGDPMAHMSRGICQAMLQQNKEAEASFRRAISLAPEHPHTHLNLALLLASEGHIEEARKEMETAASLAPFDDYVLTEYARIMQGVHDSERARQLVTRALELNPDNRAAMALSRSL